MEGLIEGRIVHYVLNENDVKGIVKNRSSINLSNHGNSVMKGEHFPATIVRVFHNEFGSNEHGVNLQVFLDGNDSLWVTSVRFAEPADIKLGTWHWIERA